MDGLKLELSEYLKKNGKRVTVSGRPTREVTAMYFDVEPKNLEGLYGTLPQYEKDYVEKKLACYEPQLEKCLEKLHRDTTTRQAVIMFENKDTNPECIMSIQFLIRERILYTLATWRSLDLKKYFEQDMAIVSILAGMIEEKLDVLDMTYKCYVGSLHYYEDE